MAGRSKKIKESEYCERVQKVITFIENLPVPSGEGQGGTFILRDFQKKFINDIYGPTIKVGRGYRRKVRRAILSIGRKNGKTALIACLVLVHLCGPEAIDNGEIFSAANDRDQAAIVFKYAAQIVRAEPELDFIKIVDSTKTMVNFQNGSFYRAISAEAGTKMGLNPSVWIYDELAQAKNRDLYDAMDTASAARSEPLAIVISTQSPNPQHILSQLIDDGLSGKDPTTVCHLYAIPDDAEDIFDNEELWKKANPALGDFRSLEEMRTAAQRAKRLPSFESAFRNLYCNQRIDAKSPLIPRAEWMGCLQNDVDIEPKRGIYLGLDLSGKIDLTSLVGVSDGEQDIAKAWFWKPGDTIKEHETRDRVPYSTWVKQGFIETTPGRSVQYDWVAMKIAQIMQEYTVLGMAYDRWSIDDFLNACNRIGLDACVDGKDTNYGNSLRLVPWGQGFKDMAPAIDAFETSILERKLIHNGHPCLTWNVSNAMAIADPAGNRKIDKSKTRFRIDGVIALVMAIGLKSRDRKNVVVSAYGTEGAEILCF